MKRLLIFIASTLCAFASQSAIWTTGTSGNYITSGGWGSLTNFTMQVNVTSFVTPSGNAGLLDPASNNPSIWVDSSGNVNGTGRHNEGVSLPLNGCTAFRIQFQDNIGTATYTLELWCETGAYQIATTPDTNTAPLAISGYQLAIGNYSWSVQPTGNIGAARVYNTALGTGTIPPRFISGGYGQLLDAELEGNMNDVSPLAMTWSGTTPSFITTPVTDPGVAQNINSILVGSTVSGSQINGISAFANNDNPALIYAWTQTAGATGSFSASNVLAPTYTPSAFGQSSLQLVVTDMSGNPTTVGPLFFGGVVVLPGTTNVDIATEAGGGATGAKIAQLLVGATMHGTNPWSWYDNRAVVAANVQAANQATYFAPYWLTPDSHGTISCTGNNVSPTCTGSGTQFQTDFCGGGTTPVSPGNTEIIIYYPSSYAISGIGYAHYQVAGCPTQTSITLQYNWAQTVSNLTGASYNADPTGANWSNWAYSPIPANYYDNVLAFFHEYYRTGLTTYKTAAETLASNWFSGPVLDSGMNFNFSIVAGGFLISGGSGRWVSAAGIVLWGLESGANIWPGMRLIWAAFGSYVAFDISTGQLGDIREASYDSVIEGLCVLYDPSPPSYCATDITSATDVLWAPLSITSGTPNETTGVLQVPAVNNAWASTEVNSANYGNGTHWSTNCPGVTCYVHVTNGSQVATITSSDQATATGSGSNGAFTITVSGVTGTIAVGQYVSGTGISPYSTQVTVVSGSTITLSVANTGTVSGTIIFQVAGWNCSNTSGTFFSPEYSSPNLHQYLWFYNDVTQPTVPGNSNGGDANHAATGDGITYTIASCDSTTQVHLSVSYLGVTGNHGLQVSIYAGFGVQGFMGGIASGLFGWNYDAFTKLGQTQEQVNAKKISVDMMTYLQNYGIDSTTSVYFGRTFLNCEGYVNSATPAGGWVPNNDPGCSGQLGTNAEAMHACVVAYQRSPSPALKSFCDELMTAMFCKPGYTCAGYSPIFNPTFGVTYYAPLDDPPVCNPFGCQVGSGTPLNNKWWGYFFGISYADAWAVVRGSSGPPPLGSSVMGGGVVSGSVIRDDLFDLFRLN